MSGNLFQDRNWLLLKGYLTTEGEKEEMAKPYPKEEDKMGEQDPKEEKCGWGPNCPSMQGTKERSQSSPSTGTNGRPTATETLNQTASNQARYILNVTKTKQQWEQEMERLNEKYNLDCFFSLRARF